MEWKPIEEEPSGPVSVVYWLGRVKDGRLSDCMTMGAHGREERFSLGFWDGAEWCSMGTAHSPFEEWIDHQFHPTRWAMLAPPSDETPR